MQIVIALGIYAATCAAIWLGIHYGEKWIDRMFALPVIDPSKPIVRPYSSISPEKK